MTKLNFPQPLLRSSLLHDPEIILICWFGAQEAFQCWKLLCCCDFFLEFFDKYKVQKNRIYLKLKSFVAL